MAAVRQRRLQEREQAHRAAPALRKRKQTIGNAHDFGILLALEKDAGEIREGIGMPWLDAEGSPIALLGAVGCPERLVAEPQVVEHPDMIRNAAQCALVVDRRGTVFGVLQIVIAQVERRLGVVRIEVERTPPGIARCVSVARL